MEVCEEACENTSIEPSLMRAAVAVATTSPTRTDNGKKKSG